MLAKGAGDLELLAKCPEDWELLAKYLGDFELIVIGIGDLSWLAKCPGDLELLAKGSGDLEILDKLRGFVDGDCLNKGTGLSTAMVKEFDSLELMPIGHFDVLSSGFAVVDWIRESVAMAKGFGSLEVKFIGPEDSEKDLETLIRASEDFGVVARAWTCGELLRESLRVALVLLEGFGDLDVLLEGFGDLDVLVEGFGDLDVLVEGFGDVDVLVEGFGDVDFLVEGFDEGIGLTDASELKTSFDPCFTGIDWP